MKIITKNFRGPQSPLPLRGSQTEHTRRINTPVVMVSSKTPCIGVIPETRLVTHIPDPVEFKIL